MTVRVARRQEFEHRRDGTLAYLAAYDVHHARFLGRCAPTTGIAPFTALVSPSHDHRAVRQRPPVVLGRRQQLLKLGDGA